MDDFGDFDDDMGEAASEPTYAESYPSRLTQLVDDSPSSYSDIQALLEFTPDQLTQLGVSSMDEEAEQDSFSTKVVELTASNYINVEQLDADNLNRLYDFSFQVQDNEAIRETVTDYATKIQTMRVALASTSATATQGLFKRNSAADDHFILQPLLAQTTSINAAVNSVLDMMIANNIEPTVESVLQRLSASSSVSGSDIIDANAAELSAALPPYIKAYRTYVSNQEKTRQGNVTYRQGLSAYLLQKEVESIQSLVTTASNDINKISVIKQIKKSADNRLSVVCDKCGEEVPMVNIPAKVICFPTEQAVGAVRVGYALGLPLTCKCGQHHIFYHKSLNELMSSFDKENKKSYENAKESIRKLAPGASILKIHVSASDLENALPYMLYSAEAETDIATTAEVEEVAANIPVVSAFGMREAANRFYRRLPALREMYSSIFSSGGLYELLDADSKGENVQFDGAPTTVETKSYDKNVSYHDVAVYYCSALGRDYRTTKNQALFSLISSFKEDPLLSEYLFKNYMWSFENILTEINALPTEYSKLSEQAIRNVYGYCAVLLKDFQMPDLSIADNLHFAESVARLREVVSSKITKHNDCYEQLLQHLEDNINCFSYCKLVNMSSIPLVDIQTILIDERMLKICDELSDRIIITNLSDSFYSFWKDLQIVAKHRLTTALETEARSDRVGNGIARILESLATIGRMQEINSSEFQECKTSINENEAMLMDLYRMFKERNLYDFCVILNNIDTKKPIFKSYATKEALRELQTWFAGVLEDVRQKSKAEFYLEDFSPEELDTVADQLKHMKFSHIIPTRKDGETIGEYLERYREFSIENVHSRADYVDYSEQFEELVPFVIPLVAGAHYASFRSEASSHGLFMLALTNAVVNSASKYAKEILGIHNRMNTILKYNQLNWESDKLQIKYYRDCNRMLNGFYETSISGTVQKLANAYNSVIVNNYDDLNTLTSKWNFYKLLTELEAVDNYITDEMNPEDSVLNDKQEAVAEVLQYLEVPELRKIFEVYM